MRIFADPEVAPYQGFLRIVNREGHMTRTGIEVHPSIDEIDPSQPGSLRVELQGDLFDKRRKWVLVPNGDGPAETRALVFYYVQHPRQRLKGADTSPDCILTTGCYGAAVVALMSEGDRLVFRHKDYFEKVIFDGLNVRVETGRETDVSCRKN